MVPTRDGGDIEIQNGVVAFSGGLETAVYLSLFGGNFDDDGRRATRSWWGNADEIDPLKHYRSETQYLLRTLRPTSQNLRLVESAAERDLAWMKSAKIVSDMTVSGRIESLGTVTLEFSIVARGEEINFRFTENWKASALRVA